MGNALINFTQGATTGGAGFALMGTLSTSVVVSNGDDSNIVNWEFIVDDVGAGSSVPQGTVQDGGTPTWSFVPDATGCYVVTLITTDNQGNLYQDTRCFGVLENSGRFIPSYLATDESLNFTVSSVTNTKGWSPYLQAYLKAVDSGGSAYSYSQDTGPLTDISIYDGPIPVPPQLILTGDTSPSGFWLYYDATATVLNQTSGFVNLYVGDAAPVAVPPGNYGLNAGLFGGLCVLNLVDLEYDSTYRPTPGRGPQSAQYPFPIDDFYLSESVYGWYNTNYSDQPPSRGLLMYETSGSCATLAPVVGYPITDWNTQALVTDEAKFAFTAVGPGTPTAWWLPLYNDCTTHLTIKVQARVVSTSGVTETVGDVYSSVQDVVLSKGFVVDVGEVVRLVPQISGSSREWADPSMVGTLVDVQGSGYFGVITVTLAATLDVSTVVDVQVRVYDADVL